MQVLGVSIQEGKDPIGKIRRFRKKHRLTYPIVSDEPAVIIQKFGFSGIPQNIVLDARGVYVSAPETIEQTLIALKKLGKK